MPSWAWPLTQRAFAACLPANSWRCIVQSNPKHFTLLLFAIAVMAASTTAAATTYRWDTTSLAPRNGVPTISAGGSDFALAADLTSIQVIGHGTFGDGMAPTGGGTWTITQPSGTVFSGTFTVIEFLQFTPANGSLPPTVVDTIGDSADAR